jgi:hypothetical protein
MFEKQQAWEILKEYCLRWLKVNGGAKELMEKYDIFYRTTEFSPLSEFKKAEINWIAERDYNGSYSKEMLPPYFEVSYQYDSGDTNPWRSKIGGFAWNDRFGINKFVLVPKNLKK